MRSGSERTGEIVRAVAGIVLFILLVGVWVSLWIPPR
jgi:type II secretory pathway component PulM